MSLISCAENTWTTSWHAPQKLIEISEMKKKRVENEKRKRVENEKRKNNESEKRNKKSSMYNWLRILLYGRLVCPERIEVI